MYSTRSVKNELFSHISLAVCMLKEPVTNSSEGNAFQF